MSSPEKEIVRYRADLPAWIFIGRLSGLTWLIAWVNAVHGIDLTSLAIAILVSQKKQAVIGEHQRTLKRTPKELEKI
jgi:hypothetical protein